MKTHASGLTVLDLFCGGGGFSLGFYQAGFEVVLGIDNWEPACKTHKINSLGKTSKLDILKMDAEKVFSLKKELEAQYGAIDVIIGSPPCTEFSYAKNGGKGDIEKGMILVRRNLLFAAIFKPKYWMMENVPRLESALGKECSGSKESGWVISFEKLGIPRSRFKSFGLQGDSLHIPNGEVLTASDFGAHQNRKRFIAGEFPLELMDELMVPNGTDVSLGGLLSQLEENLQHPDEDGCINDPNYPHHKVEKNVIRDHDYDTSLHPMYWEEMRHYKRRHIQYGRMHLPENLDAPARTIMATYNPSSRESLILETDKTLKYQGKDRKIYRQPTIREVACIQGFPIDFQLEAKRLNNRYKLIGNAVPCQLSFALAKSISRDIEQRLSSFEDAQFLERANATLGKQQENLYLPIIPVPSKIVDEAQDMRPLNKKFKAKYAKRLRRKMLSSTLKGSSCILIFENSDLVEGKLVGSPYWKSCIQKGVGKRFHKLYIDDVFVDKLIRSLKSALEANILRNLAKQVLEEIEKGVPVLKNDWTEFPGWRSNVNRSFSLVTEERLRFPTASFFQKAFTGDLSNLGGVVGPIDFFDGLDAIMLRVFKQRGFSYLRTKSLHFDSLEDSNNHPYRTDPRIIPRLEDSDIPFVTIASIFLSVFALWKMYEKDAAVRENDYTVSLGKSRENIIDWCLKTD